MDVFFIVILPNHGRFYFNLFVVLKLSIMDVKQMRRSNLQLENTMSFFYFFVARYVFGGCFVLMLSSCLVEGLVMALRAVFYFIFLIFGVSQLSLTLFVQIFIFFFGFSSFLGGEGVHHCGKKR